MSIEAIILLITKFGIPAGQAIYNVIKTWRDKTEITDADWAELKAINDRPLDYYEKK
jgi:tetrahydromethanopterin S-methyltransferase subunit H